ncbi:hypothetical protein [Actinoplanes sp. NPDC026623]
MTQRAMIIVMTRCLAPDYGRAVIAARDRSAAIRTAIVPSAVPIR